MVIVLVSWVGSVIKMIWLLLVVWVFCWVEIRIMMVLVVKSCRVVGELVIGVVSMLIIFLI